MKHYTGCDAHKKYSVFTSIDETGKFGVAKRVEHDREGYRAFLHTLPPSSPIAIETTGNWYWMVDEMEKAGHIPALVNAGKAKAMMGGINKTDKLDARGLAVLSLNGTLPRVWIPPRELRDQRELARMRIVLVHMRTSLKNRIHATFAKYAITFEEVDDIFGVKGRQLIEKRQGELPPETRHSVKEQLELLDQLQQHIHEAEDRIRKLVKITPQMQLLMSMPGIGPVLAVLIVFEIGDITRFGDAAHLASYAGTVPRVKSSGGKTYYGKTRPDVNHYLKWAFTEAANAIVVHQKNMSGRHVVGLYHKVHQSKGHAKAVGAVRRHLAEATYVVLKNNQPYHEPKKPCLAGRVCADLA